MSRRRLVPVRPPLAPLVFVLLLAPAGCDAPPPPAPPPITERAVTAALAAVDEHVAGGDLDSAAAVAARLVERASEDARALEALGRVELARAAEAGAGAGAAIEPHRRAALDLFRRAAEASSGAVAAGYFRSAGVIASTIGDDDAALAHLAAAEARDPTSAQAPLFAAQVLLRNERFDEAAAAVARALAIDPALPLAFATRAVIESRQGRCADGRASMATARDLDRDALDLRIAAARLERRCGDPARGLEMLAPLPAAQRATRPVTEEIAAALRDLGRPGEAAEAWTACWRAGGDWRCALGAAEALLEAGDRAAAHLWLKQAERAGGDAPEVTALRARIEGRPQPPPGP